MPKNSKTKTLKKNKIKWQGENHNHNDSIYIYTLHIYIRKYCEKKRIYNWFSLFSHEPFVLRNLCNEWKLKYRIAPLVFPKPPRYCFRLLSEKNLPSPPPHPTPSSVLMRDTYPTYFLSPPPNLPYPPPLTPSSHLPRFIALRLLFFKKKIRWKGLNTFG